jgi:hypothetical protein
MNTELIITLSVLALELVLFGICFLRSRRPPDPLRPRIFPYAPAMIFLALAIIVTAAHTVSVVTGERLAPKNKMKGQR